MKITSPTQRLSYVVCGGLALIALGALVTWLVTPDGWPVIALGATLVFLGPWAVAWTAFRDDGLPDHKVEGRTFVVDLFRSVNHPATKTRAGDDNRPGRTER